MKNAFDFFQCLLEAARWFVYSQTATETHFLLAFNEANRIWMKPNIFFWDLKASSKKVFIKLVK